ncbi:MAG TPA: hypothetical protein VJ843_02615 [Candidatus Saccharimonadales bacterium]|nr:hypothetical protein [Candidatus Saccharimonadales bacterium]
MRPEQLHKTPQTLIAPPIVSRLGEPPTHKDCDCPATWTSVIKPYRQAQDTLFAFSVEPDTFAQGKERDRITQDVQQMEGGDGSGGIASYEDFAIVRRDGDLVRSIAAICIGTGVQLLPGGTQEPLFTLANDAPLLRWNIDTLPTL